MRETAYAREIATVTRSYEGDSEIRLERIYVKEAGQEEIRLSWWKGGRMMRSPADLPEDDFLDLLRQATEQGVLSRRFTRKLREFLSTSV